MMRCAMKKNEPLSIHRACLRLCVHETEEEKIESTGLDGGWGGGAECERQREDDREGSRAGGRGEEEGGCSEGNVTQANRLCLPPIGRGGCQSEELGVRHC